MIRRAAGAIALLVLGTSPAFAHSAARGFVLLLPTAHVIVAGALAVLGAATCYAVSAIAGRVLSRTDASVTLVFWTTISLSLGAGLLAWPNWVPIETRHLWVLAALAVTGFVGQLAITEAFRHGQASVIAPFEYTALAWGIALDWSLWRITPDGYTLLGGSIIIASGLYLLRKEKVRTVTVPP